MGRGTEEDSAEMRRILKKMRDVDEYWREHPDGLGAKKQKTELWVRAEFEAAHDLTGVFPPAHKCARMHGHRYTVTLTIASTSEEDVIVDYHELHEGLRDILKKWDHTNLQETFDRPSTCENLAREIYRQAKDRWDSFVASVEVQEQRDTGCRVREETP